VILTDREFDYLEEQQVKKQKPNRISQYKELIEKDQQESADKHE
jgi:hypothetical protein